MKAKTIKTIKGISVAVVILMSVVLFLEVWFWFQRIENVEWTSDHKTWQWTILICQIVSLTALRATVMAFLLNTFSSLRKDRIFAKSNSTVIFVGAAVFALYSLFETTAVSAFHGEHVWSVNTDMFIYPLLIIILGLLYKLAYEASEENNLTV